MAFAEGPEGGAQGGPACTMNMNLWLLTCLVAVFVGAWVPTVCSQGVFEDCCLAYHQHTGRAMLRRARGYLLQEVSGSCNLPAVIFVLHHTDRMVCGNPRARWVRNGVKLLDARNRNLQKLQGAQRASQGSHSGARKLSSGISRLTLANFSRPTRSNRKASLPIVQPGP
ncbi:C-C motif chemokine 25 isoform X3 [Manis javanica]|uniref:C-C motif chemokine 25 isoform X3 n=1 Tax=Manis javanica TaxID=9974 RepID=UPI00081355E8|nr:C-C motif chemokine 25 isoform X1 [Manis javanica]KAI5931927.1 C-C motif chemokine 25 [Manis javanica]